MTWDLGIIITLLVAIATGAAGYGKIVRDVEDQLSENGNLWAEIRKCREKLDIHEREANDVRREYERELSKLRESINAKDGKLDFIIASLGELNKKIDKEIELREERERVR